MTSLVYINTAESDDVHERDLFLVDAAGYMVDMSAVLVDSCSISIPAAGRPALQRALRRLSADDTLLVARLAYLGNSTSDVAGTIGTLARRSVCVICLELGTDNIALGGTDKPLKVLQLAVEIERSAKRARALEASAAARLLGLPQGRPASLTGNQQRQALRALAAGKTISSVAQALNTSRQTIIRLRDASTKDGVDGEG